MIVVADAGPIQYLLRIGVIDAAGYSLRATDCRRER